jgi:biotin carboxylase
MLGISPVRILILGSNPETAEIVTRANQKGYVTFVVNPLEDSPAKAKAAVSYNADPRNAAQIDEIILREEINAVLLGVSDPLLPFYLEICERHNLPCYANLDAVRVFSSKLEFSRYCQLFGIKPIPNYDAKKFDSSPNVFSEFPVVVKPVDNGAAVGVSLCENQNEMKVGIALALANSLSQEIIVEKFMECDDLFAYYSIENCKVELAMLADRYKSTRSGKLNSVCLYADYPSKHLSEFVKEINPRFVEMIESLKIVNGVLGIQVFYDGIEFYAYDPGFRLQGEGPHFYLNEIHKFDQIDMLLDFASHGEAVSSETFNNDPTLKGYLARTIWILGRTGVVSEIHGLDEISKVPNVIKVLTRFSSGDCITEDMIGTERQVLMRIYTIGKTQTELADVSRYVSEVIKVVDAEGKSLISDIHTPMDLL